MKALLEYRIRIGLALEERCSYVGREAASMHIIPVLPPPRLMANDVILGGGIGRPRTEPVWEEMMMGALIAL